MNLGMLVPGKAHLTGSTLNGGGEENGIICLDLTLIDQSYATLGTTWYPLGTSPWYISPRQNRNIDRPKGLKQLINSFNI